MVTTELYNVVVEAIAFHRRSAEVLRVKVGQLLLVAPLRHAGAGVRLRTKLMTLI